MFSNISLETEFTGLVDILNKENKEIAKGELIFSPFQGIYVDIEIQDRNKFKDIDISILKCSHNNQIYTLSDCEVWNCRIYASLLIQGDINSLRFNGIEVILSGVSEWFNSDNHFEYKEGSIIRKIETKEINVDIKNKDKSFSLSSHYGFKTESKQSVAKINEFVSFLFENKNNIFSKDDILSFSNDLSHLFTILMDCSVLLEQVRVRINNDYYDIFFNTSRIQKKPYSNRERCFAHNRILSTDWSLVFDNYYKSKFISYLWPRFAGMINFEGFWEYEIFGYVSFVDRYCKIFCEGKGIKGNAHFNEKLKYTLSTMNSDIINILNLNEKHFKHIKKIRDEVAHCDELSLHKSGNITYEMSLKSKLVLLLTYWFFRDVGLSDKEFMLSLRSSLHPTTRKARINTEQLDRALGDILFVKLKKNDFEEIKRDDNVFLYNLKDNSYSYHKEASELFREWYKLGSTNKYKSINEYLSHTIKDKNVESVSYLSHMYVENNDTTKEIWSVCILNAALSNKKYMSRTSKVK